MTSTTTQTVPLPASTHQFLSSPLPLPSNKASNENIYCFLTEWFDPHASLTRPYYLFFFLLDESIEMYDIKNKRTFLKRCQYPSIKLNMIFPGAQISVYARQLRVLDYGDDFTRSKLAPLKNRTLALLKPRAFSSLGRILSSLIKNGFVIGHLKKLSLSAQQAAQFYGDTIITPRASALSSGPIVAIEFVGEGVVQSLLTFSENPLKSTASGKNLFDDIHISTSARDAELECEFFFGAAGIGAGIPANAQLDNCTLGIIKPHAIAEGLTGDIIECIINSGEFDITGAELFNLDRPAAEEFFEVYKGVLPEYHLLVEQLTSGASIALEIQFNDKNKYKNSSDAPNIVSEFREFCGPSDPIIARHIRPSSLRAKYGVNKVKNALHCTDLSEDGPLESEFFFNILQKVQATNNKSMTGSATLRK